MSRTRNKPPLTSASRAAKSRLDVISPVDDSRVRTRVGRVEPEPVGLWPVAGSPEETSRKSIDFGVGVDQLHLVRADKPAALLKTEGDGVPEVEGCRVNSERQQRTFMNGISTINQSLLYYLLYELDRKSCERVEKNFKNLSLNN